MTTEKNFSMTRALEEAKLGGLHWRVFLLSAMGVFLDGFDLFIIGIALPLIAREFAPGPIEIGLIGSAAVLGSVLGGFVGGKFIDQFGRKSLYIVDMIFFVTFGILSAFSWGIWSLIAFRFFLGMGVGVDYPICASYVSEFMPTRIRGRMLISAFSFQALGMLCAAVAGLIILKLYPGDSAWRYMLAVGAVPAFLVMVLRVYVPESPRWLIEKGNYRKAAHIISRIIPEVKDMIEEIVEDARVRAEKVKVKKLEYSDLFRKQYLRRTILAVVPWFCMDIATYGVGLFTPTILAIIAYSGETNYILKDIAATKGAAYLDIFLIVGFALNIWLVEKWGRIKLQLFGFAGMFVGLLLLARAGASMSGAGTASLYLVIPGFILFNLLMNMGPNATTFILPAELFPTKLRASAHGLATSSAKFGATVGIFILPIVKNEVGLSAALIALAIFVLIGLAVTAVFRVQTMGRSLEEINAGDIT